MQTSEPQIRYCTTEDRVGIAFYTLGEGPALVHMPPFPLGHLQLDWRNASNREYNERLAAGRTFVRYDGRGAGLSDRDVSDYSGAAKLRDANAVVNQLGLETFALLGFGHSAPAAIEYAATYPERVSHLILWHAYARASDVTSLSRIQAARQLIATDFDMYAELEGYRVSGFRGGPAARWYTEYIKQSVTPDGLIAAYGSIAEVDVTGLLAKIEAPTLIIARRASEVLKLEVASQLTAAISRAKLVVLEGMGVIPFPDVLEEYVQAVHEFLGSTAEPAQPTAVTEPDPSVLTPREREILCLAATGRTSSEIARELSLSVRTVGRHITNVYAKIGARSRSDATAYAIRHRLL
jgi:pimeloyl-ACP methyl ester carboxylesterase/DNA-binding CsgD family transcriptional regulator